MTEFERILFKISKLNKIPAANSPLQAPKYGTQVSVTHVENAFILSHKTTSFEEDQQNARNSTHAASESRGRVNEAVSYNEPGCGLSNSGVDNISKMVSLSLDFSEVAEDTKHSQTAEDLRDFLKRPKLVLYLVISCYLS